MRLLATGGYFDGSGECFVDAVEPSGSRERLLTFTPPGSHRIAGKGFTGAAWLDGDLLVCTFDAVWRFGPGGELRGRLHQPDFNDLHGISVLQDGTLGVCNTGLDAVEFFAQDGTFRGRSAFTPAWFEAQRQQGLAIAREAVAGVLRAGWTGGAPVEIGAATGPDYDLPGVEPFHRLRVRDYLHPNHVVEFAGRLCTTMLATRELRCVRTFEQIVALPGHPHDGVVQDGRLVLTLTDGRVVAVEADGSFALIVDTARSGRIGWCRGLALGAGWLAVGLTEIRFTPQFHWRGDDLSCTETSVLWFDTTSGEIVGRAALTDRERHSKVFSLLHPIPGWA